MRFRLVLIFMCTFSAGVSAENTITSYFGFTTSIPDEWIQVRPDRAAEMKFGDIEGNKEMQASISEIEDQVRGGNVEFYYDKRFLNSPFKANVSIQKYDPILIQSLGELQDSCSSLPAELKEAYGEEVNIEVCKAGALNNWAVLHYAYFVPSNGVLIIQNMVPVNAEYSYAIVAGGPGTEREAINSSLQAQKGILHSLTKHLSENGGQ